MVKIFFSLYLLIILIPYISADVIMPGYKPPIPVENIITNIAEFPDYVFVGMYFSPRYRESLELLSYAIIDSDGRIPSFGYYGHGIMSGGYSFIYAIKNEDIKLTGNFSEDIILLNKTLNQSKAIKTIENISFVSYSGSVTYSDKKITNEYVVSLESVSGIPQAVITDRSPLRYVYYAIPLLGMFIFLYILIKRRKNAN